MKNESYLTLECFENKGQWYFREKRIKKIAGNRAILRIDLQNYFLKEREGIPALFAGIAQEVNVILCVCERRQDKNNTHASPPFGQHPCEMVERRGDTQEQH